MGMHLIFIWESLSNKGSSYIVTLPQYSCKHRLRIRRFPYLSKDKKEISYSIKTLVEQGLNTIDDGFGGIGADAEVGDGN